MNEKAHSHALLLILSVLVIVLAILCCILWLEKGKAEKTTAEYIATNDKLAEENREARQTAEEYKASYDSLLEEFKKAEEEKRKAAQLAEDYQAKYDQLVNDMLEDAVLAERIGNLIIKVWHNAIWDCRDEETDKFTMPDGKFVSDFNDALYNLFNDEDFSEDTSNLSYHQFLVKDAMKEMLEPPDGFENAFRALENMYNAYISFTNIVIRCSGSFDSFSKDFSDADRDLVDKYAGAALYTKFY